MLIKHTALTKHIYSQQYYICHVVIGNDTYLLEETITHIKKAWNQGGEYDTLRLELETTEDWDFLLAETRMGSLFANRRFIDTQFNKKNIDLAKKTQLQTYLTSNSSPNDLLLIRAPEISAKSITWLSEDPRVLVVQVTPLESEALLRWIADQLHIKNISYTDDIPEWIHRYTQGNMLACAQWIERLSLMYPNTKIHRAMLASQCIDQSQFQLFDLADACLSNNITRVLQIMRFLQHDRTEPSLLLWLLSKEIRLLLQLHHARLEGKSMQQACKALQIWSSRAALYEKSMQRLSISDLSKLIERCQQTDKAIKSHQHSLIWIELERLALMLCR